MQPARQARQEAAVDAVCNVIDATTAAGAPPKAVAFGHLACAQCLPPLAAFRNLDTTVTVAPCAEQVVTPLVSVQHGTVPFNDLSLRLAVDTPLFTGTALLLLRNMANTPKGVFEGKRRQMVLTIQGRFKQAGVSLDSLVLGSDFVRPLRLPAGPLISTAITWLASKLGGGVSVKVAGPQPHIHAPLIAAAQVVRVSDPGQPLPDLLCPGEDMRLFDTRMGNAFTGQPWTAKQRRSHFRCAANRRGLCFDAHRVWTFQMYEDVLDYASFRLNMPLLRLDMVQLFDGQPLQLMLKDLDSGHSLLHLTVWHRRMLQHPANQGQDSCAAAAAADGGGVTDAAAQEDG